MLKRYLAIYIQMLLIAVLLSAKGKQHKSKKLRQAFSGNKEHYQLILVVDVGHGGKDPGCRGVKCWEKDICLKVAKKLQKRILDTKRKDIRVVLTRNKDNFIELGKRASIANTLKEKEVETHLMKDMLFLSIHCDSAPGTTRAEGAICYVMGDIAAKWKNGQKNINLKAAHIKEAARVAQKENNVITFEKDYKKKYHSPTSVEANIMYAIYQNTYFYNSVKFAEYVQGALEKYAGRKKKGVRKAPFLVLWKALMPSILLELGFINNPKEAAYLACDKGQQEIAKGLSHAVFNYVSYRKMLRATPAASVPKIKAKPKTDSSKNCRTTKYKSAK